MGKKAGSSGGRGSGSGSFPPPPAEKLPGRSADSFTDCAPSRPPHFLYINTAARLDRARPPKPPSLPSDLSLLLSHSRTTAATVRTCLDSINSTDAKHHSDFQSFQNNLHLHPSHIHSRCLPRRPKPRPPPPPSPRRLPRTLPTRFVASTPAWSQSHQELTGYRT